VAYEQFEATQKFKRKFSYEIYDKTRRNDPEKIVFVTYCFNEIDRTDGKNAMKNENISDPGERMWPENSVRLILRTFTAENKTVDLNCPGNVLTLDRQNGAYSL